jgi:hypothetical protein
MDAEYCANLPPLHATHSLASPTPSWNLPTSQFVQMVAGMTAKVPAWHLVHDLAL